jgi:hypothetical protein
VPDGQRQSPAQASSFTDDVEAAHSLEHVPETITYLPGEHPVTARLSCTEYEAEDEATSISYRYLRTAP